MKKILFIGIGILFTLGFVFLLPSHKAETLADEQAASQLNPPNPHSQGGTTSQENSGKRGAEGIALLAEQDLKQNAQYSIAFQSIQKMESILSIDIREELIKSSSPKNRLSEFESSLAELIQKGEIIKNEITASLQSSDEQITLLTTKIKENETLFFTSLENLHAEESDMLFEEFVDSKTQLVRVRAERGRALSIGNKISDLLSRTQNRLTAVQNNREALIAGVQFDARTARSLGLIKDTAE